MIQLGISGLQCFMKLWSDGPCGGVTSKASSLTYWCLGWGHPDRDEGVQLQEQHSAVSHVPWVGMGELMQEQMAEGREGPWTAG